VSHSLLIGLAGVLVLGMGAQWLAWRLRLPSILLLLIFGFISGPLTGFLDPDALLGDLLFPIVSISVGVILFEGGLSLRLDELKEVGRVVRNLISIGVLVTWALTTMTAYMLLDFRLSVSLILGSILVVTGPTVIIPLLRHIRPTGRVGTIAKWEGIMNDPIGAILAVLMLEGIILVQETVTPGVPMPMTQVITPVAQGLLHVFFISLGVSFFGTVMLILLLHKRLLPDYLQNSVALMVVVGCYALSNHFQHESGLLTTTLMGIALANQRTVAIQRIIDFKEDLRVLIIGALFILLSARLKLTDFDYINWNSLWFLLALILVIRPLAVFISSLGTRCSWKEQVFLSMLAPRGIVAASVTALFSFRLATFYPQEASGMVPLIFLVIIGTVTVYSLGITPLARWLGLAQPNPQGVLFIGAHPWAQAIAKSLSAFKFDVLMIDSNTKNVSQARQKGLRAEQANALLERTLDRLDLGGMGRVLILTPNDEVNSLAALHFSEIFDSTEIYQLATRQEKSSREPERLPKHLRGHELFSNEMTYLALSERFQNGDQIQAFKLNDTFTLKNVRELTEGQETTDLFMIRQGGTLSVITSESGSPTPQNGDTLLMLVEKPVDVPAPPVQTRGSMDKPKSNGGRKSKS
jgi:NhaP-type Na+/H+ or K+/H+ antiporter